ncbi:MAG: ABC transporter substrate-binding protein [Brevundimonas sp.]|jgi:peptide/nickel transport system substrate-binding protein
MTTRRLMMQATVALAAIAAVAVPTGSAQAQKRGGEIVMAQQAQPPTIDGMTTTAQATRNISLHIWEMIVTRDENANVIGDLATAWTISPDGLTYTFTLREARFHNGKMMTSADAKASLERYGKVGGSPFMRPVKDMTTPDPRTLVITLSNPVPGFLEQLSSPRAPAVVIPAEEAGKAANQIENIGTGPYRFVEFRPDSHVKLARFDGYIQNTQGTGRDGFGGKKTAWVDTITIRFVPEGGARTAGLQSGEFQVLEQMPTPTAKRLANDRTITTHEMMPWAFQVFIFNAAQAPTNNPKVRQAIQAAIDPEEVMAISTDGSYRLLHGWQYPGTPYFQGDLGKENYNQKNAAKAKALLAEAGYKGEELLILTDSSFKNHNDTAITIGEQLKAIGMKVNVRVVDWPTALSSTTKKEGWNAWPLMMGIEPYEGPYNVVSFFAGANARMQVQDPVIDAANQTLTTALGLAERQAAFGQFQKQMMEQAYVIKVGEVGIFQATRANVKGYKPYRIPRLWDVWVE